MEPTLMTGESVLLIYDATPLERYDMVAFTDAGGGASIKRLFGLPSDRIQVNGAGDVRINLELIPEGPGRPAPTPIFDSRLQPVDEHWRHGGEAGLAMLGESAWRPPVATMAAARAAVEGAGIAPGVLTVTNNRITGPGFQLRLSRQGQWWRFEKRKNRWEITAPPEESADDLLLSS